MVQGLNPGGDKKFTVLHYVLVRHVDVVGVVTRLWAGVQIMAGTRDFSHLRNVHPGFGLHSS